MNTVFELHPNLAKKDFVIDLSLCRVLLEDNQYYPWLFLVPRVYDVRNMVGLSGEQRLQLMREIELCERVMSGLYKPSQLNVAAIGNVTPQLHVHVICRFENDPHWPNVVWGQSCPKCSIEEKQKRIQDIQQAIGAIVQSK